jgi:DNA-binding NtrC family response regulator
MAENDPSLPLLLLLEDEVLLVDALRSNLENQFEIEVAGNVEEALLLLGTRKFRVIVSDYMLPGRQQGLDFLVEALRQQPEAKRVLMTGYLNPELLARSVTLAKLSACLIKPMDIAQLRRELSALVGT